MLVGAADIALGGDGNGRSWGLGRGATGISGDPYHFYTIDFDGGGGSKDNQRSAGAIFVQPATELTLKSQTPTGSTFEVGTQVTIVVTEKNTGNDPLTNVSISGGGKCTSFTPASVASLAVGASQDFTCTFTASAGTNAWSADGLGTDSNGNPVPSTNEHQDGSVFGVAPATTLTLKSQTPSGANVAAGTLVTIVVTEKIPETIRYTM
jgi:hypothetical protein